MSKIVFVSPSNTAKMLLTEAMVRYAHKDDTLVFVDAASKGDLDANIAALAANQDIIYVACNISDTDTGITDAQETALNAKLKAVTGELKNFTSTDQTAVRDMAWQAWAELFGTDTFVPMAIYYTSELTGVLTPTEELYGVYLKNAIKARYYGELDVDATLNECLSVLDRGFISDSGFKPAYLQKAPSPVIDTLVFNDLLAEGLAIYNYDQAKSGYIYINKFDIKVGATYYAGVIDHNAGTIAVGVPNGTVVTALVARFTLSDFSLAYVGETPQVSGVTTNNYTSPVTFTIVAEAGGLNNYVCTVVVAP
jgi:cellobiose-specific phosphotransferase system component IIB